MRRPDSRPPVARRPPQPGRRGFLRRLAGAAAAAGGALAAAAAAPRPAAQTRFLTAAPLGGGFELYYETHGEGPPVVLAHGAGGTHLSWWQQIPALSAHFRCVTFDHRGFGRSRDAPDGPGRTAFVDDLRALLDHLDIDRATLVGQSMGGRTVLGFAARWPERVSALVLCGTTGGYTDPEVAQALADRPAERGPFAPAFAERAPERAFLYREIQRSTLDRGPDGRPRALAGRTTPPDIAPIVEQALPTLFVVGTDDTIVPPPAVEAMQRKLPGSEYALVPAAGHSVYYERPAVFNRLVIEFVRRHAAGAAG